MNRVRTSVVGWFLCSVLLLPLLSLVLAPGVVAQDITPTLNLFTPFTAGADDEPGLGALPDSTAPGGEIVMRSRSVLIEPSLLPADPARASEWLTLNLFDDTVLLVVRDRVERAGRGYAWLGHVEGVELSQVTLLVVDGRVIGNIVTPQALYQVRHLDNERHVIRQVNQSAFLDEAEAVPVNLPAAAQEPAPAAPLTDDGSLIDVLVVYTPAARGDVGGTAAMEDLIYLALTEANTSYANSGVTQRLRLVNTAEISYIETGNIELDLGRLQATSDSYMDIVHTWRETYGADEVVLLVLDGGSFCGISYMMDTVSSGFAPWAFAVVQIECATGYYSFAHELGHNMGARHDWYRDSYVTPYTHAHGYVDPAYQWRTVMAYGDECGGCARLPYWSNPDIAYGGTPMGVPEGTGTGCAPWTPHPNCDADNRKTLNKTAWTVANFRQSTSVPPNTPTGLSATAISPSSIALTWTDNSDDESGFEIERSPNGVGSWAWIASTSANTPAFTDTGLAADTRYYYRVRAFNPYGASGYSSVANAVTLNGVGPLAHGDYRIDDDGTGLSSGDGDGIPECGETIELFVRLTNAGEMASTVVGTLDSADPYVTWPGNFLSTYGDITAGGWAVNEQAFELALDAETPHGYAIPLMLESLATNGGPWTSTFDLVVRCGYEPYHLVYLPIAVRDHAQGFSDQFADAAAGWQVQSGDWWVQSPDWYTTGGVAGAWASVSRQGTFTDLDYQVAIMRGGCETCAHGLLIRGRPQPLGTVSRWASGYGFYITRQGRYAVFEYGAGDPITLQGWTPTAAVQTGGSWNTLRVVASDSRLWFYINGALVWLGTDDTYPTGQVGIALYRDVSSVYNQLWVDWARLTTPVPTALDDALDPVQRALNAAAPLDSDSSDGVSR